VGTGMKNKLLCFSSGSERSEEIGSERSEEISVMSFSE